MMRSGSGAVTDEHQRRLTQAHKPDVPSERARIKEAGGTVEMRSGVARLGESQLLAARKEREVTLALQGP